MALSKPTSPDDRTRFFRLGLIIIEELTPVMQDILANEISPSNIFNSVKQKITLFQKLGPDQIDKINNAKTQGYKDFDITLLYTVLRNLCPNIPKPTKGWGISEMPEQSETTLGDDIERIRLIRNKVYGHISVLSVSESLFREYWSTIFDICNRMQVWLPGKNYIQSLQLAEGCTIDSEQENMYMSKIKDLIESEKSTRELLQRIITERELLSEEIVRFETKRPQKRKFADAMTDTSIKILNDMVSSINEKSSESHIEILYESIEEFIKQNKEESTRLASDPFFEELSQKIEAYANLKEDDRMKILARFLRFILKLKKTYNASVVSSNGSLLLRITFASERGYKLYKRNLENGEIGKQILEVFLYPPYLASFNLQAEDLIVYLNDQKLTQEQVQMTMPKRHLKEYQLGSPLMNIKMCESHELPFDMICEDCDEFICFKCAKTDHRVHDWNTLTTAATQRRRGLPKFLMKIKEEGLYGMNKKIEKVSKQMTENKKLCDSEIKKLHKHVDEIVARMKKIKKHHEETLICDVVKKNDKLNHVKSELAKKRRRIIDTVEFMEENNSTMSDYSLIDNHRELTKMLSELEVNMTNCEHSVRFTRGEIYDDLLESLVGKILDLDDNGMTQINSFQYGNDAISVLETFKEDKCYIKEYKSEYLEKVNKQGIKKKKFSITPNDLCVTDTGDVYFTDYSNNAIRCLSPSGLVSTVISTDPLQPFAICQSVNGGLLVTLRDRKSDLYKLESHSRRLVRHITVTGDVIHEYEYQEDGQTRLFIVPRRVTQNRNSDICVVNSTSVTTGELVIISPSGLMKSVYHGQNLTEDFKPADVVCDSFCNILVTDPDNKQIHLLSSDREFLKFLLTENEVSRPFSLSLYKSTLWVGYLKGLVKVFEYSV